MTAPIHALNERRCGWCGGKGRVPAHWFGAKKTCPECSGSGLADALEHLREAVDLPSAISSEGDGS